MCFSSNVSFIAAGVLAGTGIITYKATHIRRLKPLAIIPFLFALQQLTEGIVWLTHNDPASPLLFIATHVFFGTALIFWPSWLSFSLWYAETDPTRKKIISGFFVSGVLFSAYSLFLLYTYPLTVEIVGNSVSYVIASPHTYEYIRVIAYLVPTVLPLFISSIRYAWLFGVAISGALAASYVLFYATYGSVWCFFAALLSMLVWFCITQEQRAHN